ncbi:MAG: hypothetical protein ACLU3F_01255 [Blautia wexlerae]
MKRKRNHSLRSSVFIFLAALFLLFTCSVSTIYASTLQKPDIAASGKFVKDGDYWIYRYDDKTIAKNVFLKIDKKTYYFNKLGTPLVQLAYDQRQKLLFRNQISGISDKEFSYQI